MHCLFFSIFRRMTTNRRVNFQLGLPSMILPEEEEGVVEGHVEEEVPGDLWVVETEEEILGILLQDLTMKQTFQVWSNLLHSAS